jgi:hypothetical protein
MVALALADTALVAINPVAQAFLGKVMLAALVLFALVAVAAALVQLGAMLFELIMVATAAAAFSLPLQAHQHIMQVAAAAALAAVPLLFPVLATAALAAAATAALPIVVPVLGAPTAVVVVVVAHITPAMAGLASSSSVIRLLKNTQEVL